MVQPEHPCAYCGRRPADPAWRPFCSERCKLADLGRWLSEEYRIPGEPLPADDEDAD
ncbi:MAG: DNA gyrase inhibitor YacG [Acidobacteriota bacterium]